VANLAKNGHGVGVNPNSKEMLLHAIANMANVSKKEADSSA